MPISTLMLGPMLAVALNAQVPAAEAPAADDAPPVGLIAGSATAIVPLVVGGVLMAHDQSPRLERTGVIIMASGFVLAPVVAHGLEGSWRRAAIYGGVTAALAAGAVVVMEEIDAFSPHTGNDQRIPMKILLPLSMGSSALGVVMSLFDRRGLAPVSRLSLWVAPDAGGAAAGLGWSAPL
jgi:hypothetical protein